MKEKNKNEEKALKIGLNASIKSNNIKGAEMLINNGATINESQYQMRSHKTLLHYAAEKNLKEFGRTINKKRSRY